MTPQRTARPGKIGRESALHNVFGLYASQRKRATKSILSAVGAIGLALLGIATPARAKGPAGVMTFAAESNLPVNAVQNVKVCNTFGRSVLVRWDAPQDAKTRYNAFNSINESSVSAYHVAWQAAGQQTFESKLVEAAWGKPNLVQVQPLDPAKAYTVTITPVDSVGRKGKAYAVSNIRATGAYESELKALTGNGKNGFLYLPENDKPGGRVDPTKIASDLFGAHIGDTAGKQFDHSSVAVNGQQHWHMITNDTGSSNITSRLKSPISLADGGTRKLMWDCDRGPLARSAWYIVLTPNKMEKFNLFPNFHDFDATGNWPQEAVRIRVTGDGATAVRVTGGNLADSANFNWRQYSYVNVRQRMGLTINQQGLTFQADANYDGNMQTRGSLTTDLSKWKECYVYLVMATYNNKKANCVLGTSATGQQCFEYEGGNMHWGNVAFDAPANRAPETELSYFAEPDLRKRMSATYSGGPISIAIADPIPSDATSQELVFTDEDGAISGLTGRNKLRVVVNGYVVPNKYLSDAYATAPTYRWSLPAGVLRQGANQVVIGEDGAWEPISFSKARFDITVPNGSPSVSAYTPPPASALAESMPDHTELEGWTIPRSRIEINASPVSGKVFVPFYAGGVETAHLAGNAVPIDKIWVDVDGQTVLTQDTNTAGVGTLAVYGGVWIDTTKLTNGYHVISMKTRLKSGSMAENHGQGIFQENPNAQLTVYNGPKNKTAPKIERVQQGQTGTNVASWTDVAKNGTVFMKVQWVSLKLTLSTPSLLKRVYIANPHYTWIPDQAYFELAPGNATTVPFSSGLRYTFNVDMPSGYDWFWYSPTGQYKWNIVAIDVDGNKSEYPFDWSVVFQNNTGGGGGSTSAPEVKAFTADPMTVRAGWATKLAWYVTGVDAVTIDNGIGSVYSGGSVTFVPAKTTTYTLTAKNAKGTVTKKLTVTVVP